MQTDVWTYALSHVVKHGELWHVTLHFVREQSFFPMLQLPIHVASCFYLIFSTLGSQNVDYNILTDSSLTLVLVRNILEVLVMQYVSEL